MSAPDSAVADQIATALNASDYSDATYAAGTWVSPNVNVGNGTQNIFVEPVVPVGTGVPVEAIYCLANGGPPPDPVMGDAVGGDYYRYSVQVWVRGDKTGAGYAAAEALAQQVQQLVHKASITGYMSCLAQQAQPIYMQTDSGGYHEFALNFELWAIQ